MGFAGAMAVAMAIDALVGWPAALFARIGHPVTWLGALIHALDTRWNRDGDSPALRRAAGIAAALMSRWLGPHGTDRHPGVAAGRVALAA